MKIGILRCLILASGLATAAAGAATISNITVLGQFANPTNDGIGNPAFAPVVSPAGLTTVSTVSWGEPPGILGQSSYVFTRNNPGDQTLLPPPVTPFFLVGTFNHRNFVVDNPYLLTVQLNIQLTFMVDGTPTGPLVFTYELTHDETPNGLVPCPHPTPVGEGCTDRVTIAADPSPTVFNVGGIQYTLDLSFQVSGVEVSQLITRENVVNDAQLVGRFQASAGEIPEPRSFLLTGTALVGLGLLIRRKRGAARGR